MNTTYEQSILFGGLWCRSKRRRKKKIDVNAPHCINITPTAPCGAITIFSLTFFTCATDHAKKEGLLVVYNGYKCRDHHFFQVSRKLILIYLILQRLKYFRTQIPRKCSEFKQPIRATIPLSPMVQYILKPVIDHEQLLSTWIATLQLHTADLLSLFILHSL